MRGTGMPVDVVEVEAPGSPNPSFLSSMGEGEYLSRPGSLLIVRIELVGEVMTKRRGREGMTKKKVTPRGVGLEGLEVCRSVPFSGVACVAVDFTSPLRSQERTVHVVLT